LIAAKGAFVAFGEGNMMQDSHSDDTEAGREPWQIRLQKIRREPIWLLESLEITDDGALQV
jgi:hypothetical protein